MNELRSRTVAGLGGLSLAVQERGRAGAPTVILVHGYPDNHHLWDLVAEHLEADHHVVTYDVRGAGESVTIQVLDRPPPPVLLPNGYR